MRRAACDVRRRHYADTAADSIWGQARTLISATELLIEHVTSFADFPDGALCLDAANPEPVTGFFFKTQNAKNPRQHTLTGGAKLPNGRLSD